MVQRMSGQNDQVRHSHISHVRYQKAPLGAALGKQSKPPELGREVTASPFARTLSRTLPGAFPFYLMSYLAPAPARRCLGNSAETFRTSLAFFSIPRSRSMSRC